MTNFGTSSLPQTQTTTTSASGTQSLSPGTETVYAHHGGLYGLAEESGELVRDLATVNSPLQNSARLLGVKMAAPTADADLANLIRTRLLERLMHFAESGQFAEEKPATPGPNPQPVNRGLAERLKRTTSIEGTDTSAWYASLNDDWD